MDLTPLVLDFESFAVQPRPDYPPRPVSVAIKRPHRRTEFLAWGHPTGNNCTLEEAKAAIETALSTATDLLCHNLSFDAAVLEEGMGITLPPWIRLHDTMVSAFLCNPYEPTFALKPLAEKHLGLPPEERDAVRDWLVENGICRAAAKDWGAFIALAPAELVGPYAIGDVDRTLALHKKFFQEVLDRGMEEAYNREMALMPILMRNEREGVRVDHEALAADVLAYSACIEAADNWLRQRLCTPQLNVDSNEELANALESTGVVTEFERTATGKRSVAKGTLTHDKFNDEQVFLALGYRNRLQTAMGTFMLPWLETAQKSGGRIFTRWRQNGAVTGRMSSSPNFQNVPKNWYDKPDGYKHPEFLGVRELPMLRRYILPDAEDHVLVAADFSGQEVRVTAHYEDGALMQAYLDNPRMDPHAFVRQTILELTGRAYERRVCKVALFSTLYGAGPRKLAEQLALTEFDARQIRDALFAALPGVKDLDNELKARAKAGQPYRTAGGREYYCEPPVLKDGRVMTFDYKMLNTLVQGSSADVTKAAMVRYDRDRQHGRMLMSVHDELLISVPAEHALDEARVLVEAMTSALVLDVPMEAEAKMGNNFADLKEVK